MIKLFGYKLFVSVLKNKEILAYSLHFSEQKSLEHLERIKRYHGLKGSVVSGKEYEKAVENLIKQYLETGATRNIKINWKLYKNHRVYKELVKTKSGETITYSHLMKLTGTNFFSLMNALKHNPFLILIPCHRVVRKDGKPSGYTPLGPEFKEKLLNYEMRRKLLISFDSNKTS